MLFVWGSGGRDKFISSTEGHGKMAWEGEIHEETKYCCILMVDGVGGGSEVAEIALWSDGEDALGWSSSLYRGRENC